MKEKDWDTGIVRFMLFWSIFIIAVSFFIDVLPFDSAIDEALAVGLSLDPDLPDFVIPLIKWAGIIYGILGICLSTLSMILHDRIKQIIGGLWAICWGLLRLAIPLWPIIMFNELSIDDYGKVFVASFFEGGIGGLFILYWMFYFMKHGYQNIVGVELLELNDDELPQTKTEEIPEFEVN